MAKFSQVALASHIGGGTTDAHEVMQAMAAPNIAAFLAGPARTPEMKLSVAA